MGWSKFAVINPLWAACFKNEFVPEKVFLLNNGYKDPSTKENFEIVKGWIERILKEYSIENPIIESIDADEEDITKFAETIIDLVKKLEGNEVAIDMTPGRKYMSSFAMQCAIKFNSFVKKLFYLHLKYKKYQDTPFILIPLKYQKLINLLELI
ncbi:MAG: hypothetical protein ACTSRP_02200 [Candidatus Helarchaeota archaeon]